MLFFSLQLSPEFLLSLPAACSPPCDSLKTEWGCSDQRASGGRIYTASKMHKIHKYTKHTNTQIHKYTNTQIHKHKYNCDQWASGGRIYTAPAKCIQTLTPTRKKARHITQFSTGRTKKDVLLKMSRQKIQSHP